MPHKPSDFANADVDDIVNKLTTDEAISLTAGVGFWHTFAIPRLGVPAVKVSDGPNGIRGNHFFMSTPAKVIPCATALAASFDPDLVGEVSARLLAPEAKLKAASILLGPTCNIQRSPLGGRSFESFSEDPYLSGLIAASYVDQLQKHGIGACIKHYVANDQEQDRMGLDSDLSPRALREIYLMPFMLAQKYAQPWSYMTSYGKVNGVHVNETKFLLQDVLRKEWNHDGLIMSDWFGVYSVSEALNAGLDLEMPGVAKWRTLDHTNRAISGRKVTVATIKERARKVLELAKKSAAGAPEILDGDGQERTSDKPEDGHLMRKVAGRSIVLLKNEGDILPLKPDAIKKIAIIGPNAKALSISGGGSAALKASYVITPFEGIVQALPKDVEVLYSEGAQAFKTLPSLDRDIVTSEGKPGWNASWYSHDAADIVIPHPVKSFILDETNVFISNSAPPELTPRWTMHLRSKLRPRTTDMKFQFGLSVAGRAKLYLDGKVVIDNWTRQRRGDSFFASGTVEEKCTVDLKAGVAHELFIEFGNVRGPADGDEDENLLPGGPGVRLGGTQVLDPNEEMANAVKIATEADVAIVVVGLNADWETESYDRTTLDLPGRTNELVEKVAKANSRTVVVTQSGSAITMPWVDSVSALVHAWYLGNQTGAAIADVLFGNVNPSAKLTLTFPRRLEDVPSYGHFGGNARAFYSEDLFVGYKHYQQRRIQTLFPFGYGLSYTTFSLSGLSISEPTIATKEKNADVSVKLHVTLANTGSLAGAEVVQAYVSIPNSMTHTHPLRALKAFKRVELEAGGDEQEGSSQQSIFDKITHATEKLATSVKTLGAHSKTVELTLDKYAVSFWDQVISAWRVDAGVYTVEVGTSSENLPLKGTFEIKKGFTWTGL